MIVVYCQRSRGYKYIASTSILPSSFVPSFAIPNDTKSNEPVIFQKVFTATFNLIKYEYQIHPKQLATYPGCKYAGYHVRRQLRNDHVDTSLLGSS